MYYSDDPLKDYDLWAVENERRLERLPRCADCDQPIQQDFAVYINGEYLCDDCLSSYRREVLPE